MAHVFISYSSKHVDLTKQLGTFLEGCGLDIWWDRELVARGPFTGQIHEKLETAAVVVVLWTPGALTSDWVKLEAEYALSKDMLINVVAENVAQNDLPHPFDTHERHRPYDTDLILRDVLAVREGRLLLDAKQLSYPPNVAPSHLLQAKYGVVPFVDVNGLKDDFIDWALGRNSHAERARAAAGRLLHGPGGCGKTRLMIEVAAALRAAGWSAGLLNRQDPSDDSAKRERRAKALGHFIRGATDKGLALIVDYAEGRPEEVKYLAQQVAAGPTSDGRPIRLILLSRGADDWWDALHDETEEIASLMRRPDGKPDVIAYPAIDSSKQRVNFFVKSVEALAKVLVQQGNSVPIDEASYARAARVEEGTGYDRPLAIQMEALLCLFGASLDPNVTGIDALLVSILGLERDHWKKLLNPLEREAERDLKRGVAQITGLQGVATRAEAEGLLLADTFYMGRRSARVDVDPVYVNIAKVYGLAEGGLSQLEPDLVGEHHVAIAADIELIEGCLNWIEGEAEQTKRRRDLLTVLQRATQPEHGPKASGQARGLLDHIIRHHAADSADDLVSVAIDTPGDLPRLLAAAAPHLDMASVEALYRAMPKRSLKLDAAAAVLASARTQSSGDDASLSQKAERFASLGYRLSNLGRREEALAATQEAVDIFRVLAKDRPDASVFGLVKSLYDLGDRLSNLGRREEALAATQEAFDIRKAVPEGRPDTHIPGLANSLYGKSIIYRALAKYDPDAFHPDLANSLNDMGNRLSNLGRREEALAATQEAVDIFRVLAKDRPDAFHPDLANSLNDMGNRLSNLGRREEALAATQEAVDIFRVLAKDRPDAFLPDLANSLNSTADLLAKMGRSPEADTFAREGLAILEPFLPRYPEVHDALANDLRKKIM